MAWLRVRAVLLLAVLTAAVSLAAADLPCVGKWKVSVAKSIFGESTLTFAAAGPGEMQWTADGVTMKFKMDGKEYPDPWGGTSACKELDSPSWESVNKLKGKLVSTDVHWLSADGKTHHRVEGHPAGRQVLRGRALLGSRLGWARAALEVEDQQVEHQRAQPDRHRGVRRATG